MSIGFANWVRGGGNIWKKREREAERYVTGIACWKQIVLGGLKDEKGR